MSLIERVTERYLAASRPAVVLDFDETLAHASHGGLAEQIRSAEKSVEVRRRFHNKFQRETTAKSLKEVEANLERLLDSDIPVISFADGITLTVIPRPGLERFLNTLQSFATLYILSAGSPRYLAAAIPALGIEGYFKDVISTQGGSVPRILPRQWVLVDDLGVGTGNTQFKLKMLGDTDPERLVQIKTFQGETNDNALAGIVGVIQDRLMRWQG